MSGSYLEVSSLEQATKLFDEISRQPEYGDEQVVFAPGWARVHIRIPNPPVPSSISASMMDGYLQIQREIFQFAAIAKTGIADARQLNDIDRHQLEVIVMVTDGSSQHWLDFAQALDRIARLMIGRLSGRQITIIVLGIAILISGQHGLAAWLEHRRQIRLEEVRSAERLEALNAMRFANEQQRAMFDSVVKILEERGPVGQRAVRAVDGSFGAFLRAAETEELIEWNGQALSAGHAEILRSNSRARAITRFAVENMRVVEANTEDESDYIVLMNPSTGKQFRIRLSETLFSGRDRELIFAALRERSEISMELAFREVNGEVRSTTFLRVAQNR